MEQQFDFEVQVKLKQKKRKSIWKRILSVMMCTVVFCTTYMLILPAITKEAETFCGIEKHEHSEVCYEKEQLCENHVHTPECFESQRELICTEPAEGGHIHDETCNPVSELVLICGFEETEGHTHSDVCFAEDSANICGLEETEGHAHSEGCYNEVVIYGCGLEEVQISHTHTENCYAEPKQICNIETDPEHQHTDDCYRQEMVCSKEEHVHTLICFSDPSADLESESVWKATMPELTGVYAEDVVGIAESQLGYTESTRNYIVDEEDNIFGYTRYGEWYGIPYGEWNAMFVSFCMHYAGVEEMPLNDNCHDMVNGLIEKDFYRIPSEYVPKAGDVIFFDFEADGIIDRAGIVDEADNTDIVVIEGDVNNSVVKTRYEMHDGSIAGYGIVSELQRPQIEEEPEDQTEEPVLVAPEGVDAWAELVEPSKQTEEKTAETEQIVPVETEQMVSEGNTEKATRFAASTYGIRRTAASQNSARASGPLDLTPYITAVTMYDINGNVIPSGSTVTEGDLIDFKIEYTVTGQQLAVMNGENLTVITDTLTYKLPEIFQVVKNNSGNIVNSAGVKVGTFEVNGDEGTITVKFLEDFLEQNAKGIQIQGNVSFSSVVTKITESDDEHQDYQFTDKIILGIEIKEENSSEGDLAIEKEATSVSGEEIVYEIKVTSEEGTNGPVTITDRMSKGLTFKEGVAVFKNGQKMKDVVFNASSDKSSFTMTLPDMEPGEYYTIRYRCTADINLLDSDMTVRNTASVTGKDSENNELKDEVTVDHIFEMLEKEGKLNDDGSITWSITINHAKADISGWILEDEIRLGSEEIAYTGPVTITNSQGNVVASNVRLPYTFPQGSKDTYFITYTTSNDLGSSDTVYNAAILRKGDTEINELTGVVIGSPFEKSGEISGEVIQDAEGNYLLPITWTVTIDTTKAAISGGLYFNDVMKGAPSDDMFMTYDQLMAALENIEAEVVRVSGQEIEWFTAWEYAPDYGQGDVYDILQLWNNVDGCQSKKFERFGFTLGDKGIPKGNILTFSYEAYGLFPNNIVSNTTFVNKFNLMEQYEVEGKVTFFAGTVKATKHAVKYYDPEKPQEWHWNNMDWNSVEGTGYYEYEKLKDSYLAWSIELSIPPNFAGKDNIIIYEDLPEGVTVKRLGLVSRDNIPTTYLMTDDMVPGETYSWDFELYPADQYKVWGPQGAQPVSITVKYTESKDIEIIVPGIIFEVMGQRAVLEGQEEWYSYLNIYTQIDDDFEWTPQREGSFVYVNSFENRFTIENEYGDVIDIGKQTQVITRDDTEKVISKKAEFDENNIINYSVMINEGKRDLIENSGTIKIHDELTYRSTAGKPLRLRLVPGSVKLYEVRVSSDGSYTKLGEVNANYSYNESNRVEGGNTYWTHTIDMFVPDSKSLLLEYSYKADGEKLVIHDVANSCSISGVGEGIIEGDTNIKVEVKDATAQANTKGVMIYKVDAGSDGIFLEEAKFNIYIWNEKQNKYIIVHHPETGDTDFKTDKSGMIVLDDVTMDQFAYNTAYYIVEVESPNGYYISPEPYYFYIVNEDLVKYPSCIPQNFVGKALASGDIIYRQNVSEFTEIRVEKYWKNYNGANITVTDKRVSAVTLELWQMLKGDPSSAKLYGTYTMTPDDDGNWNLTITELPKATKNADGTKGTDYLYYIKEVGVVGFNLESSTNNEGINSGTIKLFNREVEGYELPETGGIGTQVYTASGLVLMVAGAISMACMAVKRRKNKSYSS